MSESHILQILGCGTSTGVPIPGCSCAICHSQNPKNQRLRSSALLKLASGQNILIDAGPDLRQQALRFGIDRVDAVLFTHAHADHILGIDDLRVFNFNSKEPIPCYGSATTLETISHMFSYIVHPDPGYEGGRIASLKLIPAQTDTLIDICGIHISPFELLHGKQPILGYRCGNLAYATDCNAIPAQSRSKLLGIETLILDGLRFEPHNTHFSITEAVAQSQELDVQQTYITHMTHTIEYDRDSQTLPRGVQFAYDGLEIQFTASCGDN